VISDNIRNEDLRVDYFQKSTRSSGATPIGCTFGAPNEVRSPTVRNGDLQSKGLSQNTKFRAIKAEEGSEKLVLSNHSELRSVGPASLSPKRFLAKIKRLEARPRIIGPFISKSTQRSGACGGQISPGSTKRIKDLTKGLRAP
jgi:hypothetical protein